MSPITAAARQRIVDYLHEHVPPQEVPPPKPGLLGMLLDHLIEAVRAERPEDRPF